MMEIKVALGLLVFLTVIAVYEERGIKLSALFVQALHAVRDLPCVWRGHSVAYSLEDGKRFCRRCKRTDVKVS